MKLNMVEGRRKQAEILAYSGTGREPLLQCNLLVPGSDRARVLAGTCD